MNLTLSLELEQELDRDAAKMEYAYEVVKVEGREIDLLLNFTNPTAVSPYEIQDKLIVTFDQEKIINREFNISLSTNQISTNIPR